MSSKTINARIKQKRDTDSNWQSKNPTLLDGEIILVDTSNGELRAKIGDGTSKYIQLPFSDESLRNLIDAVETKVDGVQDLVGDTSVSDQISEAITEHTHPVDSALSSTSENPVQNKVVFGAVQALIDGMGDEPVADQIEEAITTHNHDDRYYTETEMDTKLSTKSNTGHTHSAYVNQNAFSNVTVGDTTISADTTTDTLTLAAGSNISLTPDATNDKITIAATYSNATTTTDGLMAASDKKTLENLSDLVGDTSVSTQVANAVSQIGLEWGNISGKPFTDGTRTISWAPDTSSELSSFTYVSWHTDYMLYHASDEVFTLAECQNGGTVIDASDTYEFTSDNIIDFGENGFVINAATAIVVAVALKNNAVMTNADNSSYTYTFPKKGIYFSGLIGGGMNFGYVSTLIVNGDYTLCTESLPELETIYLPDFGFPTPITVGIDASGELTGETELLNALKKGPTRVKFDMIENLTGDYVWQNTLLVSPMTWALEDEDPAIYQTTVPLRTMETEKFVFMTIDLGPSYYSVRWQTIS